MNRAPSSSHALREMSRLRLDFSPESAARRKTLVALLARATLRSAKQVLALHELLVFARAYPDDAELLASVEAALARFDRRRDARRFRKELADSGVAGTDIRYSFYYPTAIDLARRFPRSLRIDWRAWDKKRDLGRFLHLLVPYAESPALDEWDLPARDWIESLRGPSESDGAFLARRFEAMKASSFVRETLYDSLSPDMILRPTQGSPTRTHAKAPVASVHFQRGPLDSSRPDLARAIRSAPVRVREVPAHEATRYVDMVHEAMITRSRDLDAFSHADARDVRIAEMDEGLALAVLGVKPERRLLLETVYGALTLKNGVPIGYVLFSSLFGSCEVAFNVFDTFRGAEAARVLSRVLAVGHRMFGATTFSIDPYQLGHFGNHEGLASGAWWFYYKLGFRPRDSGVLKLVAGELAAMKRDRKHRSSLATLEELSAEHVFLSLGRGESIALGALSPGAVGERVSQLLAERFGADRERGLATCAREAATMCGVRSLRGWSADERAAWERWSPVLLAVPGIASWSAAERRAAGEVARAKGNVREAEFLRRLDAHPKLRRALLKMMTPDRL